MNTRFLSNTSFDETGIGDGWGISHHKHSAKISPTHGFGTIPARGTSVGMGGFSGETTEEFRRQNGDHHKNAFVANALNHTTEYQPKPKFCNNCRKHGHLHYQCKTPITSFGLIVFRQRTVEFSETPIIEYLMIRRRDTLGFIDFMRGKYSIFDKSYISNMIVQMTTSEKTRLLTQPFNAIWAELWGENAQESAMYSAEEQKSRENFNALRKGIVLKNDLYTLQTLVEDTLTGTQWENAEWGFPKGRRNYQEKDFDCAVREFCEETGYPSASIVPIHNIAPYEEIFIGSNYKSYKHKYYLAYMSYSDSAQECNVQSSEVSCAEWKTYEDCLVSIRAYNAEKKRVLEKAHYTITRFSMMPKYAV